MIEEILEFSLLCVVLIESLLSFTNSLLLILGLFAATAAHNTACDASTNAGTDYNRWNEHPKYPLKIPITWCEVVAEL